MPKPVDIHERNLQRWLQRDNCGTTASQIFIGRLIIPPVRGLGYRTATQRGVTNSNGEFKYLQGETVTFFIGEADLPIASAGPATTPYDMGASSNEPINVIRLLHSVCTQVNDTLSIPMSVARWISGPIAFAVEPDAFPHQPVVANMIKHLGRKLIDEKTAVDRLDAMIVSYINGSYMDIAIKSWLNASHSSTYSLSLNDSSISKHHSL